MVNLHSKKRKVRLAYLLIFLALVLAISVFGSLLVRAAFQSKMKQIELVKGFLFEQLGISLQGIPKIDVEIISQKKNDLMVQEAKLARQLKELDKYLAIKRKEIQFFRELQKAMDQSSAEKKLLTKLDYNAGVGSALYYLIYKKGEATTTSIELPEGYSISNIGKMDFSNMYDISLIEFKSGE